TIFPDFFYLTEKAWENAVLLNSDRKIYRLSNEFLLIHLCSHFYVHNCQRIVTLRRLCDINELIYKHGNSFNWDEINKICSNYQFKNRVATALTYAHVLLKTSVPENFIEKELISENSFNLDTFMEGMPKSCISTYLTSLRSINSLSNKIIFIFRTVVPLKDWINAHYHTHSRSELFLAYLKYWLYLLNSYLFKRKVHLGN
ncbi:MAG: nucleotidyltransferase family protein, partial [Bacteroidia bacterium]|nr:nucleotidyltransferase family protein [Bacteroidia bacterium]